MNTPAHLIFGAAALARPGRRGTTAAALAGGLAPDLSLYLLAGASLAILQIPPAIVFGELYFSDAWQAVFAVDNSFLVWGALLAFAARRGNLPAMALAGAALIHVAADFALHADDARAHFWPLTDWRFASPLSYWDSAHGARWVAPLEGLAAGGLVVLLVQRFRSWRWRLAWGGLLALELWAIRGWLLYF